MKNANISIWVFGVLYMGIISGTVFACIMVKTGMVSPYAYNIDLTLMGSLKDNISLSVFIYILRDRLWIFVELVVLLLIIRIKGAFLISDYFFSFLFGMQLTMEIMNKGIYGILIFILCLFPQIIFYVLAFVPFYIKMKRDEEAAYMNLLEETVKSKLVRIGFALILVIIGVICEVYINPVLIYGFLNS